MCCFVVLFMLVFPRLALALMWFFSHYLQRAYHGHMIVPLLGFFFLPLTTIVYAWEFNSGMAIDGINLVWLAIAVIIDLGGFGGARRQQLDR